MWDQRSIVYVLERNKGQISVVRLAFEGCPSSSSFLTIHLVALRLRLKSWAYLMYILTTTSFLCCLAHAHPLTHHSPSVSFIMHQRITFLQNPSDSTNPADLAITKTTLATATLAGAREDRLTLDLTELPDELRDLVNLKDVDVRWVSESEYDVLSPLVGRLSPGLHVFYTPLEGGRMP